MTETDKEAQNNDAVSRRSVRQGSMKRPANPISKLVIWNADLIVVAIDEDNPNLIVVTAMDWQEKYMY